MREKSGQMADVGKMYADLMGAPGVQPYPRERVAVPLGQADEVRDRAVAVRSHLAADHRAVRAANRRVDGAFVGQHTGAHRQLVMAHDLVRGLGGQEAGG